MVTKEKVKVESTRKMLSVRAYIRDANVSINIEATKTAIGDIGANTYYFVYREHQDTSTKIRDIDTIEELCRTIPEKNFWVDIDREYLSRLDKNLLKEVLEISSRYKNLQAITIDDAASEPAYSFMNKRFGDMANLRDKINPNFMFIPTIYREDLRDEVRRLYARADGFLLANIDRLNPGDFARSLLETKRFFNDKKVFALLYVAPAGFHRSDPPLRSLLESAESALKVCDGVSFYEPRLNKENPYYQTIKEFFARNNKSKVLYYEDVEEISAGLMPEFSLALNIFEPDHSSLQPIHKIYRRTPRKRLLCLANVWAPPLWVVRSRRPVNNFGSCFRKPHYRLC
jgi:hypothetical protein